MDENAVFYESQRRQSTVGLIISLFLVVTSLSVRLYAQRAIHQLWASDNILIEIAAVRSDMNEHQISKSDISTDSHRGNHRDLPPQPTFWPWSSHSEPLEISVLESLLKSNASPVL